METDLQVCAPRKMKKYKLAPTIIIYARFFNFILKFKDHNFK